MSKDILGLKQADGSFYPILKRGTPSKKRLQVTTSKDNQTTVQINLYCASDNSFSDAEFLDTLKIDGLVPHEKKNHQIDLILSLDENDNLAHLILKLYDGYAHSLRSHMNYEEKTLFPYVEKLIDGKASDDTFVETFSKHHDQTDQLLTELKDIIIKYLPSDNLRNNQLSATLYDIYNSERMLYQHVEIEDRIFMPAIRLLEQQCRQSDVSQRISNMITGGDEASQEALSEREKEIIICVVQGMSNKEIAEHLFISTNTVTTHRRNIARKLQIHSPAGLTIYAIVNNLVDISTVKL